MKICVALCILVVGPAIAAEPRAPLDEAIVGALVKEGMSDAQVRASYDACDSGGAISMKICFRYRLKGEQIRLDNAYRELRDVMLKKSASANAESLERSQAAWTKYQQLHCSLEGDLSNFDHGAVMLACQWALAKQRADALVETLSWYSPNG